MSRIKQGQKSISDWLVTDSGVHILFGDGYRITYNPSTLYTLNLRKMKDSQFRFEEDIDSEETALYIQEKDCYLILDGDFRKDYEACTTLRQCLVVYRKYAPLYKSKWSMDGKLLE